MKSSTLFMGAASVLAMGAMAAGLSLIDSPSLARLRRLDEQRVADLERIGNGLRFYRKAHDHLPGRLDELNVREKDLKDPVTGQPYEYRIKDAASYELCAAFGAPPDEDRPTFGGYGGECSVPWWKHGQGRYCYSVSVKECK